MSWADYRRRYRLRRAVLDDIAAHGASAAVRRRRAEIDAEFGGLGDLLLDVRLHWERTEQAQADGAREPGEPMEPARLAAEQWPALCLLNAFAGHPALQGVNPMPRRRVSVAPL